LHRSTPTGKVSPLEGQGQTISTGDSRKDNRGARPARYKSTKPEGSMQYRLEALCEGDRKTVIDILNHFVKNTYAA